MQLPAYILHTALPSESSAMSDNMIHVRHSNDSCENYCIPQEMRVSCYESSSHWKGGKGRIIFHSQLQLPFIPISAVLFCNSKSLSFEMVYIQTCIEKIPGSD